MKKLIALLLVFAMALGMTACSQVSANDLMNDVPAKAVDVLPIWMPERLLLQISVLGCSKPAWRKGRTP